MPGCNSSSHHQNSTSLVLQMHISGFNSPGRAVNGRLQPGHSSRRRCASSAGPEVTLLDYGAGNVRSVRNALNKLGCIVKEVCAASLAILRAHLQTLPAQSLNEPRKCIECVHFAGQPGSRRQLNACIHFMLATLCLLRSVSAATPAPPRPDGSHWPCVTIAENVQIGHAQHRSTRTKTY